MARMRYIGNNWITVSRKLGYWRKPSAVNCFHINPWVTPLQYIGTA